MPFKAYVNCIKFNLLCQSFAAFVCLRAEMFTATIVIYITAKTFLTTAARRYFLYALGVSPYFFLKASLK